MIFPTYTPAPPTAIDHLADLVLLGAGIVILLFTILYGVFSQWTLTPGGKSVMVFVTSLDALLFLIIIGKFYGGEYPFRDVVRLAVYGYVFVSALNLVINLLITWRRGNRSFILEQLGLHRDKKKDTDTNPVPVSRMDGKSWRPFPNQDQVRTGR